MNIKAAPGVDVRLDLARLNAWRNFSSNGVYDSFRRPDFDVFFVGAPKAEIEIGAEAAMMPKPAPTKNFLLSII